MSYSVEITFIADSTTESLSIVTKSHTTSNFKDIEAFVLSTVAEESLKTPTRIVTVKLANMTNTAKYKFSRYYSKDNSPEDLKDRAGYTEMFTTPVMLRDALRVLNNIIKS